MAVSDYKTNPDENTTISGINIAEGCAPSGINNAIRQLMADVKQNSDKQSREFSKVMTGATASAAGTSGNVPAPQAGQNDFFLRGDGTWAVSAGLPLGHFFTWPFSTPPDGSIIVNGSTYSRTLYADLWTYISSKSDWVKTESEWQSIASANNGYCPYYSDGDGVNTFRVPKFAPFKQLSSSTDTVGTYHEAGLPDIYGSFAGMWNSIGLSGAFGGDFSENSQSNLPFASPAYENHYAKFYFNASKCSDKYGKSSTVQPESNEWIVCVVAYGKATNVGNVDVANVMSAVGTVQSALTNYLPTAGGTLTGPIRFNLLGTEDYVGNILAPNDQYGKRFLIDTWEEGDQGALLSLRKGSDTINPGGFEICARNADGSVIKILAAATDGNLQWAGKQIVHSGFKLGNSVYIGTFNVGSTYTAPSLGIFTGRWGGVNGLSGTLAVNDSNRIDFTNPDQGYGTIRMPVTLVVGAGDVVSLRYAGTVYDARFTPLARG